MTNEEMTLLQNCGKQNHFTVPEGYFDSFADRMMSQLPEKPVASEPSVQQAPTARRAHVLNMWMRKYAGRAAAAVVCLGVVAAGAWKLTAQRSSLSPVQTIAASASAPSSSSDIFSSDESQLDAAADYIMLDNEDIYASLVADAASK